MRKRAHGQNAEAGLRIEERWAEGDVLPLYGNVFQGFAVLRGLMMKIGLTYDLRDDYLAAGYGEEETAEFDRPDTIDAIEQALRALGHQVDRIGRGRALAARLAAGDRWDLVFNIAEGLNGRARESQVPALLDLFEIPYTFSDPLVLAVALHKEMTKALVRQWGIPTPDFAVIASADDADRIALPPPLFVKPSAEGTSKGVSAASRVESLSRLRPTAERLLAEFRQPLLVECYLPGREFTVGLVGTGPNASVVGTLEVHLLPGAESGVYSYKNKEDCETLCRYELGDPQSDPTVRAAERIALDAWRALGCRDAGRVDLRCDERGEPQFIEVNPLPGLHPSHSDLPIICQLRGVEYVGLIGAIVASAEQRAVRSDAHHRRD